MNAQTTRARAEALVREATAAMRHARTVTDPNLTPQGLDRHRRHLADTANQRFSAQVSALRAEAARSGDDGIAWPEVTDPHAWDRARVQLDAGVPLAHVVDTADAQTAAAMRTNLPAWLTAQAAAAKTNPGGPVRVPSTTAALRSLAVRLAEVSPSGEGIRAHLDATDEAAEVGPLLDHAAAVLSGIDDPHATATAHYAADHARAQASEALSPAEAVTAP